MHVFDNQDFLSGFSTNTGVNSNTDVINVEQIIIHRLNGNTVLSPFVFVLRIKQLQAMLGG